MLRVHVLHALAECLGDRLAIQDIESVSGRLSESQLENIEKRLTDQVVGLRSEGTWPPTMNAAGPRAVAPEVLKERIKNRDKQSWIRHHATNDEGTALCSPSLHPETASCELSTGSVTCMDCIAVIERCHSIGNDHIAPEVDNGFLRRKLRK